MMIPTPLCVLFPKNLPNDRTGYGHSQVLVPNSLLTPLKLDSRLARPVSQGVVRLHSDGPGRDLKIQIPESHSGSVESKSLRPMPGNVPFSALLQVILLQVVLRADRRPSVKPHGNVPAWPHLHLSKFREEATLGPEL